IARVDLNSVLFWTAQVYDRAFSCRTVSPVLNAFHGFSRTYPKWFMFETILCADPGTDSEFEVQNSDSVYAPTGLRRYGEGTGELTVVMLRPRFSLRRLARAKDCAQRISSFNRRLAVCW